MASKMNAQFTQTFFDDSSRAWHANKTRVGHMYFYKCEATLLSGKRCSRNAKHTDSFKSFCTQHCKHLKSLR